MSKEGEGLTSERNTTNLVVADVRDAQWVVGDAREGGPSLPRVRDNPREKKRELSGE